MYVAPFQIDFDVTLACNYSCKHCNVSAGERMCNELTTHEILKILQEASEIGVSDMSITGGEPLLRKDILDILDFACNNTFFTNVCLNTNGLLLTDDLIFEFKKRMPNIHIAVSLDGYNPKTYSNLRRLKNKVNTPMSKEFQIVSNNIRKLITNGIKTNINYTVTSTTINDMYQTYDYIKSLGVQILLAIKFFPFGFGKIHEDELELDFKTWEQWLINLTQLKLTNTYYEGIRISVPCPWEIYLPLLNAGYTEEDIEFVWGSQTPLKSSNYKKMRDIGCHAGVTNCAISPNGDVYPCGTISTNGKYLVCGNLHEDSLENIWLHSKKLQELRTIELKDLGSACNKCDIKHICGGGCRSRAFSRYGYLKAPDYLCPINSNSIKQE
ncbi:radical SAM protein [Treponema denticola]|uniref:Radical SAM protein n=1 Tax=Treponema denticola TaxID=158 RepID=A0A9Q9BL71_TREDN|nr:radical SAM protein [Treponema denticola]UTC91060.1 radical SAM protein [Treponema denticola]UTC99587.1 radical SAM protein [Treponema denticola]